MPETIHRTLTMRTAVSPTDFGQAGGGLGSLQALLAHILDTFATVGERRVQSEGQIIELRHSDEDIDGNQLLHLVAYTPDDRISIVPRADDVAAADLALIDAPENSEFLDGELMVLVRENDVSLCRSGISENALITFVQLLGERSGQVGVNCSFGLMKRADMDKLELIRRDGIKHISMNALAHAASVDHVERVSVKQRFLGSVVDELKALAGMEGEIPDEAENLKVEVLFTFDKRNGTELDQRELAELAEQVLRARRTKVS